MGEDLGEDFEKALANRWGDIIRKRREKLGLSQRALADQMAALDADALGGVSQGQVYRWEHGRQLPRARHLALLAEALDLPINTFSLEDEGGDMAQQERNPW
jgi:transcriptional regulator with XRE-family HTH domain